MKKLLLTLATVALTASVSWAQEPTIPAVPSEFEVTVSDKNVTVEQEQDPDGAYIMLMGETSAETVTVTLAVPEGWDGYYCAVWGEDSGEEGGDNPTPYARKRVNALADDENEYFMIPLEELTAEMPLKEGNSVTLKVGEDTMSAGIFYLYKGENALLFPIMVNPAITKVEATDIPAIPAEFDVTVSDDNVTVEQDQDTDGANIVLLGETSAETVTVTLAVPEGWDGYYCAVWGEDSGEEGGDTPTPFARKRVNALADEETEYIMMPLEELTAEMPLKEGNSVTLKVDEESISAGIFFLYKGENALYWPIAVNPSITKIEGEDIPALPEEYVVTVDPSENVEIAQDPSEDIYGWIVPHTIAINGKCEQKTATITIEVPEGWDNFIWKCDDISPYDSRKKANKTVWEDKADLIADGYTEGNVIEVPVDSRSHIYYLYPCLGDKIDSANDIQLDVMFNKFFPGLVFPEELDVTLSSEGPKVEQASEEWAHTITITGDCEGETLTVTIAVPEGWDGIIGATDADVEEGPEINPLSTRAAEEENLIFMPLEVVENGDVPLKKSNEFAFAADGTEHYGMAYLYKEDMACFKQIDITVAVNDKLAGISNIEGADSEARFFNLQGVEVANPENGVYVKVANGKASKVTVK